MPRRIWTAALLVTAFAISGCQQESESEAPPGQTAPEISGSGVDGKSIRLSEFKGKVVLVDFWATWCGPCVREIPHERDMLNKFKGRPFAILGVSVDKREDLQRFLASDNLPWPNILDEGHKIASNWKVESYPTFVLIDHQGNIRQRWIGGGKSSKIEAAVAKLVDEAEGKK
ncbi:MAG: TlpA family protein disulfide reductase [Planctomycetes bacterium]|nr:TlpA family protein disulfide reductase [Planctomycetota bacterium]